MTTHTEEKRCIHCGGTFGRPRRGDVICDRCCDELLAMDSYINGIYQ